MSERCDTLITNAHVLTLDARREVIPDGAIAIRDGRIDAVGTSRELAGIRSDRAIDARGGTVHPGFIETHMHVSYHLSRFMYPDDLPWAERVRFYNAFWDAISQEDELVSTRLACLEMAMNGTTCYLEAGSVFEPDAAAAGTEAVGLRASLGDPFLWDEGGSEADALWPTSSSRYRFDRKRSLDTLGTQLKRNRDPDALVRGHVAIRGSGSCSDELEHAACACADAHGVVLTKHQSYSALDTAADDARHGRHALVHYGESGLLTENTLLAHANVIRDDEVAYVLESGVSLSWCPFASMQGTPEGTFAGRHAELSRRGANVALGSDSINWAGAFDLSVQGLLALAGTRARTERADALSAEQLLEMACLNGARAVGSADRLGSIEVGKRADIVVRGLERPEAWPPLDRVRAIFSTGGKDVRTVLVDGEPVVEDGSPVRVDAAEVYAAAHEAARNLAARMDYRMPVSPWPARV